MSSISSVSSNSNAWNTQRTNMQNRMFAKVDTDSSGGVNASELQTMLEDVSQKTGVSFGKTAQELLTAMDSNGDGAVGSDELAQGMQSIMPPPPSTMDFAQSHGNGGGKGDDLFSKVDTDGDGGVSKSEMSDFVSKMGKNPDASSDDKFAKLDTDENGSLSQAEFEAGRPQGPKGAGGPQGAAPMGPPPGGAGKAEETGSASASSTSYDPLDTNKDGTVSEMERLAGALKDLAQSAKEESTGNDSNAVIAKLAQKLYEQISTNWLQDDSASTLKTSA